MELKKPINDALSKILNNSDSVVKAKTLKKLNSLCHGNNINNDKNIHHKNNVNSFINLSHYELTNNEKTFLNLGLNCHLQPKYDKLHKKTELEVLLSKPFKVRVTENHCHKF